MRIGVFGDSFANNTLDNIWWRYLETHGHTVTCFGEGGSSLSFSVNLLNQHADQFDWLIWCCTSVNRISFWHNDTIYHNTIGQKPKSTNDAVIDRKRQVIHAYLTEAFDYHFQEILGQALVFYVLSNYSNLTIIPCFSTPVYFMKEHRFNLYDLCQKEVKSVFPGIDAADIINNAEIDHRQGHLAEVNQRILANLINQNLTSGIFCTNYENFNFNYQDLAKDFKL